MKGHAVFNKNECFSLVVRQFGDLKFAYWIVLTARVLTKSYVSPRIVLELDTEPLPCFTL